MKLVTCPHCSHRHIVSSQIPKDAVSILPCPGCNDLIVLFRNKTIGVKREIMEHGSFQQKKDHLAEVIAHFLESGIPWPHGLGTGEGEGSQEFPTGESEFGEAEAASEVESEAEPISQSEMDAFVNLQLRKIDEYAYFKKHFG